MKKMKIVSMCFALASVAFNIAAIVGFAAGGDNSMSFVWLCLGSTFLCFNVLFQRKTRENEDKDKKE